jgi:serine/threonine-protein kinase
MQTPGVSEWIGLEIAEGRYRIEGALAQGSMGRIFLAFDRNLETSVVLKFPVAQQVSAEDQGFLDRFSREIRSLVTLSHPHIVKVIDVGQFRGLPFVVMQHLSGGSLKDRMATGPRGEIRPMDWNSLGDWLLEIAKALDFLHSQQHIHRDVKPANILFDRHGNAFLGDFGIIKALTADTSDWSNNSLTAPGFLVGTPNYVAPELVMGRPFDGRVDQYSLAMTVYEALTGENCMEGPTPSATVVNQTMVVPPSLAEILPGVSERISHAIARGLSKNPADRFDTCTELAEEVLGGIPRSVGRKATAAAAPLTSRGEPGRVPCPTCGNAIPAGLEHAGTRLRCVRCQSVSLVQVLSRNTLQLKLVEPPQTRATENSNLVIDPPDDEPEVDPSAVTAPVLRPEAALTAVPGLPAGGRDTAGNRKRLVLAAAGFVAVAATFALAATLWNWAAVRPPGARGSLPPLAAPALSRPSVAGATLPSPSRVEIHIAYGTEKQKWLEEASAEFEKTAAGSRIKVNLHGMGSLEAAQAVLTGPTPVPFHVWSPASSAYRDLFEREWRAKHATSPIFKSENLALTPMVFVMWESRHAPFVKKYGKVSFRSLGEAIRQERGWEAIGGQAEWGRFKFGHTHPHRSNSGLVTLILMAYEFSAKERNLSRADIAEARFVEWLHIFEQGVARPSGSLTHSTGTLMRDMVLRGPSQYDCLLVYENLTVDYLEAARDRWGELRVDYPEPNLWNEHPYYILDVPWSDPAQRAAASEYLAFLMSPPVQLKALAHGFRPGNPEVSMRSAESPLTRQARQGLKIDLPKMCEPPRAEVVKELLSSYDHAG